MVKKTRKVNKTMTIPQLRKAFEHMDRYRDVEGFRREWKKTFGKEITKQSAQDYLQYVSSKHKGVQSGGAAPLDYTLRAGTDLPYGSFNAYVGSGFGFANQDSLAAQCGKEAATWPTPPSGLGCNVLKGGKRTGGQEASNILRRKTRKTKKQSGGALPSLAAATSEFFSRPAGMSSPPGPLQDASMVWKGVDSLASPRPEINPLPYAYSPTLYNAQVSPQLRTF
jgi:hypothetical protein